MSRSRHKRTRLNRPKAIELLKKSEGVNMEIANSIIVTPARVSRIQEEAFINNMKARLCKVFDLYSRVVEEDF
jgi:hypothetical protein